ncbi:MAG: macro domain-containing protein [Eubacteriales bacterium]|nr:macro domain-containing protein [Eubacteriales bacterium]MDD4328156.1 macro domain-containing protein [Eubacteriales bacterium]MDD4718166.1 macro domain-containing protein [Eubacteriales bacterium]
MFTHGSGNRACEYTRTEYLTALVLKCHYLRGNSAEITPGFDLPAKHIIHTAGPVYDHRDAQQSENLLRNTYINSLKLAARYKCESVAFPLISSGVYGYPTDEALRVATSAIQEFISDHEMDVFLVVFDKEAFTISEKLLGEVASYIDEHYVEMHRYKIKAPQISEIMLESPTVRYPT